MDRIKFVVEECVDHEEGIRFPAINIYINNRSLIELVGEVEQWQRPHGDGHRRLAYAGFQVADYERFRTEMLALHGNPISVLLTCTCAVPECNCITAEISLQSEMVIWSNVQNPLFSSKDPWARWIEENDPAVMWKPVDYSELGVFVFHRQPYVRAVNDLARNWRIGRWPRDIPSRWAR